MLELWQAFIRRTKTAVAATLFVLLVMLAAAASLSAAAAGISTLSSMRPSAKTTAVASSPADVKAEPSAESAERATLPPQASDEQNWTVSETESSSVDHESSSVDQLNERLAQMQSPVTAAMDSGGVVLGERIHNTFGRLLAGLLQTLFVEEPSPSPR